MPTDKIRTLEQLDEILDDAITWRQQELALLKSMIEQTGSSSPTRLNCLLRSGMALLYAHWEGFVKEAGLAYLNFVSMQRLKYEDLAPNFIAFSMKSKLTEASQTNKAEIYNNVVIFFLDGLSERSRIPRDSDAINTESNLKAEVFRNIIHSLGLEYLPIYETREQLIDRKLLKNRNEVAHGKYLLIDKEYFLDLYGDILELMRIFRNQISNAALMEKYKRQKTARA